MMILFQSRIYIGLALLALITGCDPQRLKKCEWLIEPEVAHINTVAEGKVSLCIRNFVIGKQKCFIQADIDDYEKNFMSKTFRYADINLNADIFPRELLASKSCNQQSSP
jgi:hypothetical protein